MVAAPLCPEGRECVGGYCKVQALCLVRYGAPMGAPRDEVPIMLGTPLGARSVSYGRLSRHSGVFCGALCRVLGPVQKSCTGDRCRRGWGGPHMYCLLRDRNACPRLGRVSAELVHDWGSSGSRRFRFRRRLRCLLPVGARLILSAPLRARGRMGERGPRSACDSQLTIGIRVRQADSLNASVLSFVFCKERH
jgi:hypothetical protein